MTYLTEIQYFGSIGYYRTLFTGTYIKFDLDNAYRKMSFRNRCLIAGANGIIELSVPLINGRNQRIPFSEVRIDNRQKWQIIQWRSIVSAYRRSPWFEYYEHTLEPIFGTEFETLAELNLRVWEWSLDSLKLKIPFGTDQPQGEENDVRDLWLPRNYSTPRVGLPEIRYRQVFEERLGFLPNLSIMDLIFCAGPSATQLLGVNNS